MSKKLKLVFHCITALPTSLNCVFEFLEDIFKNKLHDINEIESINDSRVEILEFSGHLIGKNLKNFKKECLNADVIIVDSWNHPSMEDWNGETVESGLQDMANIVREIKRTNPLAFYFANLMQGLVDVHKYAQPIESWNDDKIIHALNQKLIEKEKNHE